MQNDRDFITSIRDQCNAQLGQSGSGGGGGSSATVAAITVKPAPFADLGTYNGRPAETNTTAQQPVAVDFSIREGSQARALKFFASQGGQNWNRFSWTIFDSGGGVVFHEDNGLVSGTLGYGVPESYLKQLGAGKYTLAVALDVGSTPSGPKLAFQVNQTPN